MIEKLAAIRDKFQHLEEQLADPSTVADMARFKKINQERKNLLPIIEAFEKYEKAFFHLADAREVLENERDAELRQMAQEELEHLAPTVEQMEQELRILLIPKDPEDEKNVIFEIRSGTGGDEASLFAGDLYRMYLKFFNEQGWRTELVDENPGSAGGFAKVILEVSGEGVFGKLKFESGTHRVQRVPETEAKGRVHTSAATVAVLPILEMEDVNVRREDIRRDVFRASGAGGQHVNRTESGVRLVHIPTGTVAESTESRSQHKNQEIAMGRLLQQIREQQQAAHDSAIASARRSLVGSGDRSEKIRTYNWPQNRVTDHRLEGDSKNYNLDKIVDGDLGTLIESLIVADNAERLQAEQA